jgi:hypothetical protein
MTTSSAFPQKLAESASTLLSELTRTNYAQLLSSDQNYVKMLWELDDSWMHCDEQELYTLLRFM